MWKEAIRSMRLAVLRFVLLSVVLSVQGDASSAFEVASVKVNNCASRMTVGLEMGHGRLEGSNVSLKQILLTAFGVQSSQLVGPGWLDEIRYDLAAKAPEGIADTELKPMLQDLLRTRFGLEEHRETRAASVYDLTVAKRGLKMPVYPKAFDLNASYPSGFPMMRGTVTLNQLADMLSGFVARTVVNKTGLTQRYNMSLCFAPLSPTASAANQENSPPDLFTALDEQLGLRLEASKGAAEFVIVDRIQRNPTEN